MSTDSRKRKKRQGSILLLAMFFLIVLFSLAVAFFRILPAEFHSATLARRHIQAQYALDAGLRVSHQWIVQATKGIGVTDANRIAFNSLHNAAQIDNAVNKVDADWSFSTEIRPNDVNRRVYDITTIAYYRGRPVQQLESTIQQESFAKYALFYDTWGEDFLFSMGSEGIQGPFHTNSFFRLAAPTASFWTDGQEPWVSGNLAEMTHSQQMPVGSSTFGGVGDGNMYYRGNFAGSDAGLVPFNASGSPDHDRYNRIIEGGREKIRMVGNIPLPSANSELRAKAWGATVPANLTTTINQKGPLLVNTEAGPNVPGGKVSGGIFVARDTQQVELLIAPGGHQQTRIRDMNDVTVPSGTQSAYIDVPRYRVWRDPAPYQQPVTGCTRTRTSTRNVTENYACTVPRTEAHASCGQETVFVPGPGGVSQPVVINKTCTRDVPSTCSRVIGTEPYEECIAWGQVGTQTIDPPGYWEDNVAAGTAGAVQNGTNRNWVAVGTPGSTTVDNTMNIPNWNSVVEVNDANYRIPMKPGGVRVNGDLITDANDSRLVVADGNTVTIRNDYSTGSQDFREYTVMEGRINGVTFSDGHLRKVSGTNKGSKHYDSEGNLDYQGRVIATNLANNKDFEVFGNILQYYDGNGLDGDGNPLNTSGNSTNQTKYGANRLTPGAQSPDGKHILGVVARNVDIRTDTSHRSSWYTDTHGNTSQRKGELHMYGVILAGRTSANTTNGGFGSHDNNMESNDGLGIFNLYGGIISGQARKTMSIVNASSNASNSGFQINLNYDAIAAESLEDFPRTPEFNVLRYVTFGLDSYENVRF